jgi:nucleotide-binding universal stress UspA family protein
MKTILVPTDFSETAHNATLYAASLADELSGRLQLLHVYSLPLSPPGEVPGALMIDTVELEKDVNERLRTEATAVKGKTKADVGYRSVSGFVIEEVIEAESKDRPDLIVMGIHDEGPVSEFLFGSATTDLLDRLSTPLLIVPTGATFRSPSQVALADDFDKHNDLTIPEAVSKLLHAFKSRIYVVRVVDEGKSEEEKAVADRRVERLLGDAFHSYHLIEEDDVTEGLKSFVSAHEIDMIIMQPHHHSFFGNFFRESVTRKMAFHSKIPILVLPGKKST